MSSCQVESCLMSLTHQRDCGRLTSKLDKALSHTCLMPVTLKELGKSLETRSSSSPSHESWPPSKTSPGHLATKCCPRPCGTSDSIAGCPGRLTAGCNGCLAASYNKGMFVPPGRLPKLCCFFSSAATSGLWYSATSTEMSIPSLLWQTSTASASLTSVPARCQKTWQYK